MAERLTGRVRTALDRAGFTAGATLVVAVSGGLDSVSLLDLLREVAPDLDLRLHVAHVDHGLRGEASAADARFVADLAATWGLPATVEAADTAGWAAAHRLGLEAAAREVRYRFLARVARATGAGAVLSAHTADDQVETILLHLLRGAGPTGMHGMAADAPLRLPARGDLPTETVRVVRPLLGVWRRELTKWATGRGLAWVFDASNRDPRFTRNRLRHEVLPHLARINPRWREAVLRHAALVADEHAVVAALAEAAWPEVAVGDALLTPGGRDAGIHPRATGRRPRAGAGSAPGAADREIALAVAGLQAQPVAMRRLLLRRAVAAVAGEPVELGAERVEAALDLLGARTGKRIELGAGLGVERGYGTLVVRRGGSAPAGPTATPVGEGEAELPVPGEVGAPWGGWRLSARVGPAADDIHGAGRPGEWEVVLDAEAVGAPLMVRRWRAGDRLQPLGLGGTRKLHDLFVDAKVPRAERHERPVVVSPRGIVWVAGLRIADWARVTPATRAVLHLAAERVAGPVP